MALRSAFRYTLPFLMVVRASRSRASMLARVNFRGLASLLMVVSVANSHILSAKPTGSMPKSRLPGMTEPTSRIAPYSPCGSSMSTVTSCFMSSSTRSPHRKDLPPPVLARMLTCFCTMALMSTSTLMS